MCVHRFPVQTAEVKTCQTQSGCEHEMIKTQNASSSTAAAQLCFVERLESGLAPPPDPLKFNTFCCCSKQRGGINKSVLWTGRNRKVHR